VVFRVWQMGAGHLQVADGMLWAEQAGETA